MCGKCSTGGKVFYLVGSSVTVLYSTIMGRIYTVPLLSYENMQFIVSLQVDKWILNWSNLCVKTSSKHGFSFEETRSEATGTGAFLNLLVKNNSNQHHVNYSEVSSPPVGHLNQHFRIFNCSSVSGSSQKRFEAFVLFWYQIWYHPWMANCSNHLKLPLFIRQV